MELRGRRRLKMLNGNWVTGVAAKLVSLFLFSPFSLLPSPPLPPVLSPSHSVYMHKRTGPPVFSFIFQSFVKHRGQHIATSEARHRVPIPFFPSFRGNGTDKFERASPAHGHGK